MRDEEVQKGAEVRRQSIEGVHCKIAGEVPTEERAQVKSVAGIPQTEEEIRTSTGGEVRGTANGNGTVTEVPLGGDEREVPEIIGTGKP